MMSSSRQARVLLFLSSLFVILLVTPPAGAQGDGRGPWVIVSRTVYCVDDTIVVDQTVYILAGGALILEGCVLQVDSPPYKDRWLGAENEGLTIRVEAGGRLELRHSQNRPSIIEPKDNRYGYYLRVQGLLVSDGLPGDPNLIRGLEGYMSTARIGGGLQVLGTGRAYVNHTTFKDISGPALHPLNGGEAYARDVDVRNATGAMAATNATLVVDGARLDTGVEVIWTFEARLVLENVTATTNQIGVDATRSNVTIRNSTISAVNTGVRLVDSDAQIDHSRLRYGTFGVAYQSTRPGLEHVVRASQSVLEMATPPGMAPSENGSLGMSIENARLELEDSQISNNTLGGVSLIDGFLSVRGTAFNGTAPTDVFAVRPSGIELAGNTYSASATRPVRIMYPIDVHVVHDGRYTAEGARVEMDGRLVNTTTGSGLAHLVWEPALGPDMLPIANSTSIRVTWAGQTSEKEVTSDVRALVFDFHVGGGIPAEPLPWILMTLAVAAIPGRRRLA